MSWEVVTNKKAQKRSERHKKTEAKKAQILARVRKTGEVNPEDRAWMPNIMEQLEAIEEKRLAKADRQAAVAAGEAEEEKKEEYNVKDHLKGKLPWQRKKRKRKRISQIDSEDDLVCLIEDILAAEPFPYMMVARIGEQIFNRLNQQYNKKLKKRFGGLKQFMLKHPDNFVFDDKGHAYLPGRCKIVKEAQAEKKVKKDEKKRRQRLKKDEAEKAALATSDPPPTSSSPRCCSCACCCSLLRLLLALTFLLLLAAVATLFYVEDIKTPEQAETVLRQRLTEVSTLLQHHATDLSAELTKTAAQLFVEVTKTATELSAEITKSVSAIDFKFN